VLGDDATETPQHLLDGLMKFFFARIPMHDLCKNRDQFLVDINHRVRISA